MAKPVHIFVNRKELLGFTSMRLKRKKSNMTGELSIDVFMGWLPDEPVLEGVGIDDEVLVFVGGHLAFTGTMNRRDDRGDAKSYSVKFIARGKTQALIDSSHQHDTGTMLKPTNRFVFEDLIGPFGVSLDWLSDDIDLNRFRLRDGARVIDELARVAEQCSLYVFEGRDGQLKVTDGPEDTVGEALMLGSNVFSFNTSQSGDLSRNEVLVKGQLTSTDAWGVDAVVPTLKRVADATVGAFTPITVQLYGDATDELIERRAQYEINKRSTESKQITVEVFHVQQSDGSHWDIGSNHYVELPPAGVFGDFEIVELEYIVDAKKTLKTRLVLAPKPVTAATATSNHSVTATLPEIAEDTAGAATRAARYGVNALSGAWVGPLLSDVSTVVSEAVDDILSSVEDAATAVDTAPPLTLPVGFEGNVQ